MQTKYLFRLIFPALILLLTACDTDLALISSRPNLQEPSEGLMRGMLTTAYTTLTIDRSTYGYGLWGAINGCDTDESFFKNTNTTGTDAINTIGLHNCNSTTTTHIQESWRAFYEIIEACNIVIEMSKDVPMNETIKTDLVGQAKAIRAFAHFMLAVHFGPVPIKNIPTHLMINLDLPRNSVKDVCTFALNELRAATPMLNEITKTKTTTYMTKSVAEGLSLRVGLYLASHPDCQVTTMYDSVAVWGKQLIDRNVHSLNTTTFTAKGGSDINETLPAYAQVFYNNMVNNVSTDKNKEAMWDCSFYMKSNINGPYATWNNAYINWLGSYMGIDCLDPAYGTSKIGYATTQFRPQATLWTKYEAGDIRRDWNISTYAYKNTNNIRYNYINYTLPTAMITATTVPAKLLFVVKGDKLADETIIENGGAGYKDGTYTDVVINGYNNGFVTGTPAYTPTTGTKFTITVLGEKITDVKMQGTSATGYTNVYTRGIGKWRREYETNYTSPREQF
ncbi:MAG: RagB/SusD family nutrient uptake outer membrane protein, partial [Paludibacter sp.]